MTNRTTPNILSHIPKMTNHVLFRRDIHHTAKNTDRYLPVGHDPYAPPYGQSPSPNHHKTHATTSYPPHPFHVLSPLHHHRLHVAFALGTPNSSSDLNIHPPPSPAIKPLQLRFNHMRVRIMTLEIKETYSPVSPVRLFLGCLVSIILSQKRRQPTISATVASRNVCHVGTRL